MKKKNMFEIIIKQDNEPIMKSVVNDIKKLDKEISRLKMKFR